MGVRAKGSSIVATAANALGAGLDVATRTLVASYVVGASAVRVLDAKSLAREARAVKFHARRAAQSRDPEFHFPAPTFHAIEARPRVPHAFEPRSAVVRDFAFRSRFAPAGSPPVFGPAILDRNAVARATWWTTHGPPRPTLCFYHGFALSSRRANIAMFQLSYYFERGYDIVLMTHPFHDERSPRNAPFGEAFLSRGISEICAAIAQSVHDGRVIVDHLFELGAPSVGVMGYSLGGLVTTLLASVDSRLAFAIPFAPAVDPLTIAAHWFPMSIAIPVFASKLHLGVDDLRAALSAHGPLHYRPAIERDRLLIIGARGDRMAIAEPVLRLHEHWGRPRLIWCTGNHIFHGDRSMLREATLAHLDRTAGKTRYGSGSRA